MYVLDSVEYNNVQCYRISCPRAEISRFGHRPWSAECRSNRSDFWSLMRIQTGVHHDPAGYGLGLMVTKRAPQVDGWMDGWTDATRPILLPQLSAELKQASPLRRNLYTLYFYTYFGYMFFCFSA
jgi:hypothetical protein